MNNIIKFDIMRPTREGYERFIATMRYPHSSLWKFDFNALYEWIIEKRPTLKGKSFIVYTDDEVVPVIHFNQDFNKILKTLNR